MMNFFLLLALLYFNCTFACSPVNEDADGFKDDILMATPEKAIVALTGVIIKERSRPDDIFKIDHQFIIPERYWTNTNEKKIETTSICGLSQMVGERYLLLSNSKNAKGHHMLIELEKAGEYISKLARKKDFVGDINPAWQYCKKDKECIALKDSCNVEKAVNLEYQETYLNFLKERRGKKCIVKTDNKKVLLKCINYFCT